MKTKLTSVLAMASIGLIMLLAGCGKPVPPNKIALVVKTLGERSITNATASAEIYWAKRLPVFADNNPGVRVFRFPLGLQDYAFNEVASYESPKDDAIEVDCYGGHLKFDVNTQCYIDRTAENLAEKLLALVNDHQLQSYAGERDMLARWAGDKLRQFVRDPLAQTALTNQVIEVIRGKRHANRVLLDKLNARFNKYAIVFSSAGITSRIKIPDEQKQRMNDVVTKEYENRTLRMRNERLMPLQIELNNIDQEGLNNCQDEINSGAQQAIRLLAEAQKERRRMFIALVGEDNYVTLEQMLSMTKALDGGGTKITVVPKTLLYFNVNGAEHSGSAPLPASREGK